MKTNVQIFTEERFSIEVSYNDKSQSLVVIEMQPCILEGFRLCVPIKYAERLRDGLNAILPAREEVPA